MALRSVLTALCCVLAATGCAGGSVVVEKPASPALNSAVTRLWADDIRRVARSGDWLLSRSYSVTGDLVVGATFGESLSHAALYDAERGMVIEAVHPEVREISLERFLARNRTVLVVRPPVDADEGRAAVARALARLGAGFDYFGVVGFESQDRFYCSELVVWASRVARKRGAVVTPADLVDLGELVYFSGHRDEEHVQAAALVADQATRTASYSAGPALKSMNMRSRTAHSMGK